MTIILNVNFLPAFRDVRPLGPNFSCIAHTKAKGSPRCKLGPRGDDLPGLDDIRELILISKDPDSQYVEQLMREFAQGCACLRWHRDALRGSSCLDRLVRRWQAELKADRTMVRPTRVKQETRPQPLRPITSPFGFKSLPGVDDGLEIQISRDYSGASSASKYGQPPKMITLRPFVSRPVSSSALVSTNSALESDSESCSGSDSTSRSFSDSESDQEPAPVVESPCKSEAQPVVKRRLDLSTEAKTPQSSGSGLQQVPKSRNNTKPTSSRAAQSPSDVPPATPIKAISPPPPTSLITRLHTPLPQPSTPSGHFIIFSSPQHPHLLRIEQTTQPILSRLASWTSTCNYTPILHHAISNIPHAQRIEGLIHLDPRLSHSRRKQHLCPGCQRSHANWFEIDISIARSVVDEWSILAKEGLYDENGTIDLIWRKRALGVAAIGSLTARALLEFQAAAATTAAAASASATATAPIRPVTPPPPSTPTTDPATASQSSTPEKQSRGLSGFASPVLLQRFVTGVAKTVGKVGKHTFGVVKWRD